ncbi:hypothetical protein ALP01_03698 [Pseudomonas caricapapayae]|nr:hypothetical protein ALP01_03698 [Pseudomonas caricapapayae]
MWGDSAVTALMVCFNQPAIDQDLHPERRTFAPVVLPALLSTYRSARAPYAKARFNCLSLFQSGSPPSQAFISNAGPRLLESLFMHGIVPCCFRKHLEYEYSDSTRHSHIDQRFCSDELPDHGRSQRLLQFYHCQRTRHRPSQRTPVPRSVRERRAAASCYRAYPPGPHRLTKQFIASEKPRPARRGFFMPAFIVAALLKRAALELRADYYSCWQNRIVLQE